MIVVLILLEAHLMALIVMITYIMKCLILVMHIRKELDLSKGKKLMGFLYLLLLRLSGPLDQKTFMEVL
jgi:hypothetical protein